MPQMLNPMLQSLECHLTEPTGPALDNVAGRAHATKCKRCRVTNTFDAIISVGFPIDHLTSFGS